MADSLVFDVIARDRASRTFSAVGREVDGMNRHLGRSHSSFRVMAAASAVGNIAANAFAMGLRAVSRGLGSVISEGRESARVNNLTNAVLKSTGGVANISAKGVANLAQSISNKTGVDDEAVQSGSNLLLTFKNVRNEVGRGANVFDRATQAAVDLSAAGFGDLAGTSKMLGKALNDPIRGLTALGKAGVQFTVGQKQQIKTMVQAGNILGAQKVILAEIESQVGGAAAATGTATEKAANAFGNMKESLASGLLPVIDRGATAFTSLITKLQDGKTQTTGLAGFLETRLIPAGRRLGAWIQTEAVPRLSQLWSWFQTKVVPAIQAYAHDAIPAAIAAGQRIGAAIDRNKPQLLALWAGFKKVADFLSQTMGPSAKIGFYILGQAISRTINTIGMLVWATRTIWSVTGPVLALAAKAFISYAGGVLHAAALAFGWVPKLGDKLRAADNAFAASARRWQTSLNSLHSPPPITIRVNTLGRVALPSGGHTNVPKFAGGGRISAGQPAIVGDGGRPELFVPDRDGTILPRVPTYYGAGSGSRPSGGVVGTLRVVHETPDGQVIRTELVKLKQQMGGLSLGLA